MTNEIWEYGENPKGVFTNEIVVRPVGEFPHGEWIADCGPNRSENISKARLIAAAPELLEALEYYAQDVGNGDVAKRAIAKAKGEMT